MKKIINLQVFALIALLLAGCEKEAANVNSGTGTGGSIAKMAISGNSLYIVNNATLFTYDISLPAQAVLLNAQNVQWNNGVETIFPYRDKLFIGSQSGMFVYDISNPKSPKYISIAQHLRACDPVVANDDYAYVTLRSNNNGCGGTLNQLNIYDINGTNILSPKLTGMLTMPEPYGLGAKGNIVYVCMGSVGMNVVDVTDKAKPKIVKTLTGENFTDVIPYDNILIAYVSGGIVLYDITNAADPQKKSELKN